MSALYDLCDIVKNNDLTVLHITGLTNADTTFPHGFSPGTPRTAIPVVKGATDGKVRLVSIDATNITLISDAAGGLDCICLILAPGSEPIRASGTGVV